MSARVICGNAVFGMTEPKPIIGLPPGKLRLRLRNNAFSVGYLRTDTETIRFVISRDADGNWIYDPKLITGRNAR